MSGSLAARAACFAVLVAATGLEAQPAPKLRWYKGNTHTHTINTDGDSASEGK